MTSHIQIAFTSAILVGSIFSGSQAEERQGVVVTSGHLAWAAEQAGFRVKEAKADVPAAVHPRFQFHTLEYGDPRLESLRKKYRLEKVIEAARDEWHAQLVLKEWVYKAIPGGNPKVSASTASDILAYAAKGETFYCTHYAITYTECALALGWQCRKIGVDRRHGPQGMSSTHHGVAEVWSNQFQKWVVIDPQSNLHFEKNGVPLGGWEIRAEWLKDRGAAVDHVVGVPPRAVHKNPAIVWWKREEEDETATYFWLYVETKAVRSSRPEITRHILPLDAANEGLIWYQNDSATKSGRLHVGYRKNRFLPTRQTEDAYWTVGIVEPSLRGTSDGEVHLKLTSYRPGLTGYEMYVDGRRWKPVKDPDAVVWTLKSGSNALKLRTVGRRGVSGPETSLRLVLDKGVTR